MGSNNFSHQITTQDSKRVRRGGRSQKLWDQQGQLRYKYSSYFSCSNWFTKISLQTKNTRESIPQIIISIDISLKTKATAMNKLWTYPWTLLRHHHLSGNLWKGKGSPLILRSVLRCLTILYDLYDWRTDIYIME